MTAAASPNAAGRPLALAVCLAKRENHDLDFVGFIKLRFTSFNAQAQPIGLPSVYKNGQSNFPAGPNSLLDFAGHLF